jgi:putative endonuclease
MTATRQKARAFGRSVEWRAALWLMLKGYRIIARNFLAHGGEIDLVALSPGRWLGQGALCFVEVRGRTNTDDARDSVGALKQTRIKTAAREFLTRNPRLRAYQPRFDIVAAGRAGRLIHVRNAFDA